MRCGVALPHQVHGIYKLPAGLGLGDPADSHRTRRNIETWGIAEATTSRGHGFLRLDAATV